MICLKAPPAEEYEIVVRDPHPDGAARNVRDELLASVPRAMRLPARKAALAVDGPKIALVYTRYSTSGQNQMSTARQVEDTAGYAKRAGFQIPDDDGVYSDEERSGFFINGREALERMLARVRAGGIHAVLIGDSSRLARDFVDLGWLYRTLRRHGVELHTALGGKMDMAQVAMHGYVNHQQVDTLVHNTRHARRSMVAELRIPWGARNFGYVKSARGRGHVEPDPVEKGIVKEIFRLAALDLGRARIAAILNERGQMGRRKKPWTADAVGRVVNNVLYRGIILYGRYIYTKDSEGAYSREAAPEDAWVIAYAEHLAIVDDAAWEAARPKRRTAGPDGEPRSARGQFLLSELVRCPTCERHMVCLGGRPSRFVCSGHNYNKSCPNTRSWDMGWVETGVLRLLAGVLDDASLYEPYLERLGGEAARAASDAASRRDELVRRRVALQAELVASFDDAYTEGLEKPIILQIRKEKQAKVDAINGKLAEIGSPRVVIDVARRIEELGGLASALRELSGEGAIDLETPEGKELAGAIRALIRHVVPTPDPHSHGVHIELALAELGFYDPGAPADVGPARVVRGAYVPPSREDQSRRRGLEEAERHLASGACSLDRATWAAIRHLVPDEAVGMLDGRRGGAEALVEVMLLALRLRRAATDLPDRYGSPEARRRAIRRFVRSGWWARVATALEAEAPHLLDGIDPRRFDYVARPGMSARDGSGKKRPRRNMGIVVAMLSRPRGATLPEISAETGQASRAIRVAISRLRCRRGFRITKSRRPDGLNAWLADQAAA